MLNKPMAVLGAGDGGRTMAADLTLAGYSVHLYEHPRFRDAFSEILSQERIELRGIGRNGVAELARATTDMEEAVRDARLIHVVLPAFGQELFFSELCPHLRDGHTVIVWAGDFGSLRLAEMMRERGVEGDVLLAEANTLPYGTRAAGPATQDLKLTAARVTVAALPAARTGELLPSLQELWPGVIEDGGNAVVAALCNLNPICHPPGSLLNVGRIQWSEGEFYMYREGITEAPARVIRELYEETAALGRALGRPVLQYEDRDFRNPGTIMAAVFRGPFDTHRIIGGIRGPESIESRYITEDLPYGLVPMSELGEKLSVPTPLIDAIITLGGYVCDRDFRAEGRTLESLGLADMDADGLLTYVEGGS